jgi:hypothetical protein
VAQPTHQLFFRRAKGFAMAPSTHFRLVMEPVENATLAQLVAARGSLSVNPRAIGGSSR